jgi:hypothetical protein
MAEQSSFKKSGRTVRLINGWRGIDGAIAAGTYDANDPALLGKGDYLLANGHAVESALYEAIKDVPGVIHAPEHPAITQEQADKGTAQDEDGDDVPNSADDAPHADNTRTVAANAAVVNALGEQEFSYTDGEANAAKAKAQAEQRKSSGKKS